MDEKKNSEAITLVVSQDGITTFVSPHTGKPVTMKGDGDEALAFVEQHIDAMVAYDEARDRKLLRKIDMYVLPPICLLYALQFMDKQTISYAAVLGLRTDLKMEGDMYAWAGSVFYYGYLAYEFIGSYTLQRFPLIPMTSLYIMLWGVVLCLHAVPQYAGFMVLRVILGALELSITPAFLIVTSQWYKKEEVFLRTACWVACNGVGTMLGSGAIAYNTYKDADNYTIVAWKLIFIITGVITIFCSVLIYFHLPSKPTDAWFLTEEEKVMVVERIRNNQQGFGNKHFKKEQFIEALTDYRTWVFFIIGIACCIPNGGLTNFGSILLNTKLGYSVSQTLLLGMITGAVELVGCIGFPFMYNYYPVRLFWAAVAYAIVIMSSCFVAFADNNKLAMAGYSMFSLLAISLIIITSLVASNCAGHTKKVTVNAIFLIGYCVGNIIGPQTFRSNQAPEYMGAVAAMVGCTSLVFVMLLGLWADYYYDNKRRDARMDDPLVKEFMLIENHEFADLTDKQNPLFRYTF